jgi:hypothetical protein
MSSRPDKIFISVDESTRRSTISFAPANAGTPILHEDDVKGELALRDAKEISAQYGNCPIHGPHFHAARPPGRKRMGRKPAADTAGED